MSVPLELLELLLSVPLEDEDELEEDEFESVPLDYDDVDEVSVPLDEDDDDELLEELLLLELEEVPLSERVTENPKFTVCISMSKIERFIT